MAKPREILLGDVPAHLEHLGDFPEREVLRVGPVLDVGLGPDLDQLDRQVHESRNEDGRADAQCGEQLVGSVALTSRAGDCVGSERAWRTVPG
jgi:hypothetical protein